MIRTAAQIGYDPPPMFVAGSYLSAIAPYRWAPRVSQDRYFLDVVISDSWYYAINKNHIR